MRYLHSLKYPCGVAAVAMVAMSVQANAEPLHFATGSYGALGNGRATLTEPRQTFTFNANAGQTLIITFTGAGPMRGEVQCVGGGDGPYYGGGDSFNVPATGECRITVGANPMAEQWTGGFTLAVLAN
jgi:hypothetical protein